MTDDHDRALGTHVARLLARLDVDLVIDVGARQGEYGHLLRQHGYHRRIVSFEPVSTNFEVLNAQTGEDTHWDAYGVALGSQDTVAAINVSPVTHFSSLRAFSVFGKERFAQESVIQSTENVTVRRLDSIWAEIGAPDSNSVFLKVDTQGWDLEVLRGAGLHLRHVLAVQIEIALQAVYEGAPLMHEALAALSSWGFEPTGFYPVAMHADGRLIEVDCVALRRP